MQDLHLVTRRHFFRSAALAAGAPFAAAIASNPVLAAAANPDRTLRVADVLSMTPVDMARESRVVSAARTWLEGCAKRLNDAKLRQTVLDVMADPVPNPARRFCRRFRATSEAPRSPTGVHRARGIRATTPTRADL